MFRFHRSEEHGFSMVEVLCAMTIAAMALVVLLRGTQQSQSAASYLDSHLGARIIANTILQDEMAARGSDTSPREGDSGVYRWRLRVEPASVAGLRPGARLNRVTVTVTWPKGSLSLDTLKLRE
ncbi:MAG: prepilin-type N-terminal cleavage/methylation domain-containing protein [Aestuariivirga sp.]